jgi:hypothetical protein
LIFAESLEVPGITGFRTAKKPVIKTDIKGLDDASDKRQSIGRGLFQLNIWRYEPQPNLLQTGLSWR